MSRNMTQFSTAKRKRSEQHLRQIPCYCRRQLNDDGDVDFEHFVDKDFYPAYTYEIKILACLAGHAIAIKMGDSNPCGVV